MFSTKESQFSQFEILRFFTSFFTTVPVPLAGLGMPILLEVASEHFESSKKITPQLIAIMILQGDTLPDNSYVKTLKLEARRKNEA